MICEETYEVANALSFTEDEFERVTIRVYEMLKRQAYQFNGCDSTSMTIERAQDLLESLLYTLEVAGRNGVSKQEILYGDIKSVIDRGQRILEQKKRAAKVNWKLLKEDLPRIRNVYYLETVKNLGIFFDWYNIYYEANHIPCSIDYWLLCPVNEELKGISFIEEYLERLQMENDFLNAFDIQKVKRLLRAYVNDYEEVLFNLCDPILSNAIGGCLLGKDGRELSVNEEERKQLLRLFSGKSMGEIKALIEDGVTFLCTDIGMNSELENRYFSKAAEGLAVRIFEAAKAGDIFLIFLTF